MINCRICAEMRVKSGRQPWNEPLIETENFVVIPSLGALVEGWVLVVPKKHQISMGALPIGLRGEAEEIERKTRGVLSSRYEKPIIAFEHGPSAENHGTGCGVDHAHLHLVPLECDLLTYVRPFVPASVEWKACNWDDLAKAHTAGLDYLYLRPEGENGLMAVSQDFGSQVFRKAVASFLCLDSEYSWRDHPRMETVSRTIGALTDALVTQTGRESEYVA
jgi:diadenosine tetraphosphate (Ap4A) HIT family hydrolase